MNNKFLRIKESNVLKYWNGDQDKMKPVLLSMKEAINQNKQKYVYY